MILCLGVSNSKFRGRTEHKQNSEVISKKYKFIIYSIFKIGQIVHPNSNFFSSSKSFFKFGWVDFYYFSLSFKPKVPINLSNFKLDPPLIPCDKERRGVYATIGGKQTKIL